MSATLCVQCDGPFEPRSSSQRYCSTRCRWDHSNGRAPALSRMRREHGFAWPPVNHAQPVTVKIPRGVSPDPVSYDRVAIVLPDTQYGFWRCGTEMIPTHDPLAISAALAVCEIVRPDVIVHLGDVLDLPEFGRYQQEPGFAMTTQAALDVAHRDLACFRALCDEMYALEGNHDARITNAVIANSKAAAGILQANPTPEDWPVLSVPHLLRLGYLGIEWVDGYPVSVKYLNDNLACIHGTVTGPRAVEKTLDDERVSVIFGHTHHAALGFKTRNSRGKMKQSLAYSPGTLSAIDGRVPGTKAGLHRRTGRPVKSWQDWQQGIGLVYFTPGDGPFHVEHVPIIEGVALFRSQRITAG